MAIKKLVASSKKSVRDTNTWPKKLTAGKKLMAGKKLKAKK